jgi:hypothetical protein
VEPPLIVPSRSTCVGGRQRIFSLAHTTFVGIAVIWLGLPAIGCGRQAAPTAPDATALKREAEALKKQNGEMMKSRR